MFNEEEIDRRYLLRRYNDLKILLVADLHLGFEAEWSRKGLETREPTWSYKVINRLKKDIKETHPDQLIILGDIEHSFAHFKGPEANKNGIWVSNRWLREKALSYFMEQIVEVHDLKISLVRGNQDTSFVKSLNQRVEIFPQKEASLFGQLGVFHGHMKPSEIVLISSEMMLGHVHPSIDLVDELKIHHKFPVFAKLTVTREEVFQIFNYQFEFEEIGLIEQVPITILPAYNFYLSGFTLNQSRKKKTFPVLWNLIRHPKLRIQLTNGIELGKLEDLIQ
ncbi:MAG: metallophosphoesterase [Candidatus Heimdallarchaeota archaeon]|nr:MAG: metallophosphoesterase [Candidatus Heimdallarchaeota archaeon]